MWANPGVYRFIGGQPLTREDSWRRTLVATSQWPLLGFGYWIVERTDDGTVVGQLGFADFKREMDPSIEGEPEFGYVFDTSVHGHRIAFEACSAALRWADQLVGGRSCPAIIDFDNSASMRLAEKLGFERQSDAIYKGQPLALFRRSLGG